MTSEERRSFKRGLPRSPLLGPYKGYVINLWRRHQRRALCGDLSIERRNKCFSMFCTCTR